MRFLSICFLIVRESILVNPVILLNIRDKIPFLFYTKIKIKMFFLYGLCVAFSYQQGMCQFFKVVCYVIL